MNRMCTPDDVANPARSLAVINDATLMVAQ